MKKYSLTGGWAIHVAVVVCLGGCASSEPRLAQEGPEYEKPTQAEPMFAGAQPNNSDQGLSAQQPGGNHPQVLEIGNTETAANDSVKSDSTTNNHLLHPGSGVFINETKTTTMPDTSGKRGDITLNFEKAEISQVAAVILGDVLKVNYLIDPAIKGQVTIQTTRPMTKESVLPVLENVLKLNGAKLLYRDGVYEVVPESKLLMSAIGVGRQSVNNGFSYQVVPLQYIAADEMAKILEPSVAKGALLRIDSNRNLLILGGDSRELLAMLALIDLFDVDWLGGMSVGLMEVRFTDVDVLAKELEKIFAMDTKGPLTGLIRFVTMERLNSILVITSQPAYLERVGKWVKRLDKPSSHDGKQFYVYPVKNTNADELARTLNELFIGKTAGSKQAKPPEMAPGLAPFTAVTGKLEGVDAAQPTAAAESNVMNAVQPKTEALGVSGDDELSRMDTRIIAANDTNSLLIFASPSDYHKIESAIAKLDVVPLQVLVEASIVDVRLTGEFAYGMQWFFTNSIKDYNGLGQIGDNLAFSPTFAYTLTDMSGMLRGVIRLLAEDGKVNVLSSPSLMVRNNETASIRVGDQQPISTSLVSSTGNVVASSVQFKDTGVILEVTPRINSDGMVSLEVNQEVTDVGDIDDATGQRSFLRRSIRSSVAVNSGETLVLGGLIRENKAQVESGVPFLRELPFLGVLFGQTVTSTTRTELMIMLTPRIVRDKNEARQVTEEYRRKLHNLTPIREIDSPPMPSLSSSEPANIKAKATQ